MNETNSNPNNIKPPPAGGPKAPEVNPVPPPAGGPKAPNVGGQPMPNQGAAFGQQPQMQQMPPQMQQMQMPPQMQQMQQQINQQAQQIQQLQQQLQIAQAVASKEKVRSEDLISMTQRLQADFDNYRKRTSENTKKLKEDGVVEVVEKLLNVLDTFKRAITMITDVNIQDGVKMIYRQLNDVLLSFGVTEIPALGEQFDPELHNAIMTVKAKDKENSGVIVEVLQKGYIMGTRVIRHTAVKVAQ